jgi:hypothetical protein
MASAGAIVHCNHGSGCTSWTISPTQPAQRTPADARDVRSLPPKRGHPKVLLDLVRARGPMELRCTSGFHARLSYTSRAHSRSPFDGPVPIVALLPPSWSTYLGRHPVKTSRTSSGTCAVCAPGLAASDQSRQMHIETCDAGCVEDISLRARSLYPVQSLWPCLAVDVEARGGGGVSDPWLVRGRRDHGRG